MVDFPRVQGLRSGGYLQRPVGNRSYQRRGDLWSFQERIYWYDGWAIFCLRQSNHCYAEESLLVIRGFGIQTSTSSSTYLSTAATRFIPTTQIQDIIIHEAFKGFEVRFYLAVIVEGEPDVLVVFPVGPLSRCVGSGLTRFPT